MREIPLFEHACLKPLLVEDAVEMFTAIDSNRIHLREWLPWVDDTKVVEDTVEFITLTLEQKARNQGIHFGIWYKGRLAGTLGVHRIDWHNGKTTMGYWLTESFQGKGLMTSAVIAYMREYIFGVWQLNKLEIHAATQNSRSRAIPERLGFHQDGVLRQNEYLNGRYVDHVVYSLVAEEWQRNYTKNLD
ncbi:GNAT family N-acetyltransferase [Brevibacillus fluminis]|uniref:GNAT family N-acetyltransferase n=1 Tax=Brevibacillus fluminis TaxID=511487 RepID=UPI003F89856D